MSRVLAFTSIAMLAWSSVMLVNSANSIQACSKWLAEENLILPISDVQNEFTHTWIAPDGKMTVNTEFKEEYKDACTKALHRNLNGADGGRNRLLQNTDVTHGIQLLVTSSPTCNPSQGCTKNCILGAGDSCWGPYTPECLKNSILYSDRSGPGNWKYSCASPPLKGSTTLELNALFNVPDCQYIYQDNGFHVSAQVCAEHYNLKCQATSSTCQHNDVYMRYAMNGDWELTCTCLENYIWSSAKKLILPSDACSKWDYYSFTYEENNRIHYQKECAALFSVQCTFNPNFLNSPTACGVNKVAGTCGIKSSDGNLEVDCNYPQNQY